MKKLTLIVAALALVMGFSQCKKDNLTPNDNRIQITLNANYGGDRTSFTPGTSSTQGSFGWSSEVTEYINVSGNNSGYLGYLTNENNIGFGTFTGSIATPVGDETLYFFYLGNGNHAGANTLDFSNQVGDLDHVTNCHVAIGRVAYKGQTEFNSVTLEMKMAIARFNLSGFGSETVYLNGENVYSTASINYKDGSISGNSKGYINVGTAGADKYVALIPSVTSETVINFNSSTKTSTKTFPNGIQAGKYYANGDDALSVTTSGGSGIPGTFSVSATKKVFFSKGNLQYQASTGTWRFAEHQYDYVGDATYGNVYVNEVKSNNANIASDYTGWIDLFGWGTSGYNDKYPYMSSTTTSEYYNNAIKNTQYDWGVYNSASISGGDGYTTWRTLTSDEWTWILGPSISPNPGTNCRTTTTSGLIGTDNDKARFVMATVNSIQGMIIFPDNYSHPNTASVTYNSPTYNGKIQFDKFVVDATNWEIMSNAGAVFIPTAGYRNGTTIVQAGSYGYYWSSTKPGTGTVANSLYFFSSSFNPANGYTQASFESGHAVRLVRE